MEALSRARPERPRVLRVDLTAGASADAFARAEPWSSADAFLDRVGCFSGAALALALLEDHARGQADPTSASVPLVLAVGQCVRRGLPTAARASIASRAPLTGRLSDGQVGGDLARRLASVTDALSIEGSTRLPGAVLVLRATGEAELASHPELAGATPRETHARLRAHYGAVATLCIGPAGEARLPFASLVGGGDPPHFVGRGGLGAVLGRAGLKALVVDAPEVVSAPARELAGALLASPRLEARAREGTLELFGAFAARGDPELGGASGAVRAELEAARQARHGCRGCPTPCGWVFRTDSPGGAQAARFSATQALGLRLGLEQASDALLLLARCDQLGVDAREVGAGLAILATARERGILPGARAFGERAELERWLDQLAMGTGQGALLSGGAAALARGLGLEGEPSLQDPALPSSDDDPAALLAACVSSRGSDPMRTFPFLVHDGSDRAHVARLVAPLALPAGAEDPRSPEGKGRLVFWHENLSAALDTSGFCAFSAAAVLADGSASLEQLAEWIEPAEAAGGGGSAAERLLSIGTAVVHLARRLEERWDGRGDLERVPWARGWLEAPGLWPEYARLRGLDPRGRLSARSRAAFDAHEPEELPPGFVALPVREDPPVRTAERTARGGLKGGRVTVTASGPLGDVLGAERTLELDLPAAQGDVLDQLGRDCPAARRLLFADGRSLPAIYRAGRRLLPHEAVESGDRLELVLVISGGAR